MLIAAVTVTYFARYALKTNIMSEMLNDRTLGQDFVPEAVLTFFSMFTTAPWNWGTLWENGGRDWVYTSMWLPQIPMWIGTILLTIAVWVYLTRLLVNRETSIIGEAVE